MYRIAILLLLGLAPALYAEEAVVTLRSTVSGNQEQPRVMYILPWQQPGDPELDYELRGSIAQELFSHIDRDEFVRGLTYRAMLQEGVLIPPDDKQHHIADNH